MTSVLSRRPTLPLTMVSPGEMVELVEIRLNSDAKQRLHELGLTPGASIRIVKNDPMHGMIISVRRDGRLALDRATAHKLLVSLER
jgi:Fe2+ transport system protein FeoA